MSAIVTQSLSGDLAIIDKMIANIGASAKVQAENIQKCAAAIVVHAVEHGDVSRANSLVDALGQGVRRDSLVQWFTTEGCMTIKDKRFGLNKTRQEQLAKMLAEKGKPGLLGHMVRNTKPWFESKKEKDPFEGIDLTKALRILIKKAEKAASSPESLAKSNLELLPMLKAMVPMPSSIN